MVLGDARFGFGRMRVDITGDSAFARAVSSELEPISYTGAGDAALTFQLSDRTPRRWQEPGLTGSDGRHLQFRISWDGPCPLVHVAARLPVRYRLLPRPVFRAVHRSYMDPFEHLAKGFTYQVLDGLVQAASLEGGQTFLHASAVQKDDIRIAVVARGGMGKTGTLLRLVEGRGWGYLSDDWTILDDGGVLHLSHKPVQIHPRNVLGFPDGDHLALRGRGNLDRFAWHARRRLGRGQAPRRRTHAVDLFGPEGVGSSGDLTIAYLVERGDVPEIQEETADRDTFTRSLAAMTCRELAPAVRLLEPHLTHATPTSLSLDDLLPRTESVLGDALKHVESRVVRVPQNLPEPEIERYLISAIDRIA